MFLSLWGMYSSHKHDRHCSYTLSIVVEEGKNNHTSDPYHGVSWHTQRLPIGQQRYF